MTDSPQLLSEYARTGSDAAFRELVSRYVDLVYSTALRLVDSDTHRAEDIAQTVFIDLARMARTFSSDVMLGGWLHRHTCFVASKTMRGERRRQIRERQAVEMNALQNHSEPDFALVRPILDEAINELDEPDRTAILLRFFEQRDFRSVSKALGSNEDAARLRVTRALEKLESLLKRRGITTTAAALSIVLMASAVQSAPVGLAVAISTAALAGTAASTSTAIVATKAIAMTTIQKAILLATVAVVAGAGIYEAHQTSQLRQQVQALQQQQEPLTEQIQALQRERDAATNQLVALRQENESLHREAADVLKLRNEVSQLRSRVRDAAQSKTANPDDSMQLAAETLLNRVALLKQKLAQMPEANIPELQLLTPEDWLVAAKGSSLNSEADYRRALSSIRNAAESRTGSEIQKGLKKFLQSKNGQWPTDLSQLKPYFDPPLTDAILDRWQITSPKTVPNVGVGSDFIITQKAPPVDDVFDTRMVVGEHGSGSTDYLEDAIKTLQPVYQAYRAVHNGQWQTDFSELLPYATTPEQSAALQKMILRHPTPE